MYIFRQMQYYALPFVQKDHYSVLTNVTGKTLRYFSISFRCVHFAEIVKNVLLYLFEVFS